MNTSPLVITTLSGNQVSVSVVEVYLNGNGRLTLKASTPDLGTYTVKETAPGLFRNIDGNGGIIVAPAMAAELHAEAVEARIADFRCAIASHRYADVWKACCRFYDEVRLARMRFDLVGIQKRVEAHYAEEAKRQGRMLAAEIDRRCFQAFPQMRAIAPACKPWRPALNQPKPGPKRPLPLQTTGLSASPRTKISDLWGLPPGAAFS